ncbi:FxsA family protein [Halovivax gelatinilyticus]|uniref:FxsA family protein n=1 Tax=Halovivax gelatinilyticus TaxID=2961597 RepID=UPI0020CA6662|nr:FxsA family protein [Halovivax gelatinilyticus]
MLRWILALLAIPFLDAVLLGGVIVYVDVIGFVEMIALVVLTGFIGLLLVRAEGRRTMRKIQRSLAAGEPPTNELLDGALLIAAGAFLLTPGLVTDAIGFLIVIPLTRIPIRMLLKRRVVVPYVDTKTDGFATGAVWTGGFPDGGGQYDGWDSDGSTVTLGDESYSVDPEDVTTGSDGSYRIDSDGDDEPDRP